MRKIEVTLASNGYLGQSTIVMGTAISIDSNTSHITIWNGGEIVAVAPKDAFVRFVNDPSLVNVNDPS